MDSWILVWMLCANENLKADLMSGPYVGLPANSIKDTFRLALQQTLDINVS